MRAWQDLGWSHFRSNVLRIIEHLQVIDFGTEYRVAIMVPPLRWSGTLGSVITHQHRQTDFLSKHRTHGTRHLRMEQDIFEKPILENDRAWLADRVFVQVCTSSLINFVWNDTLQYDSALLAEVQHLGVRQRRLAIKSSVYHILLHRGLRQG